MHTSRVYSVSFFSEVVPASPREYQWSVRLTGYELNIIPRSDRKLTVLITYIIGTGVLTSICATAILITVSAAVSITIVMTWLTEGCLV